MELFRGNGRSWYLTWGVEKSYRKTINRQGKEGSIEYPSTDGKNSTGGRRERKGVEWRKFG